MTPNQVNLGSMIFAGVSAVASCAAFVVALIAAKTWKAGLTYERLDDCIAATHDCAAAIGRALAYRRETPAKPEKYWPAVRDAWSAWSKVRSSYAVARRYLKDPPTTMMDDGDRVLRRMTDLCHDPHVSFEEFSKINKEFTDITNLVDQIVLK